MRRLVIGLRYLRHSIIAKGAMRIHSPFVYSFYREIAKGKGQETADIRLIQYIKSCSRDKRIVHFEPDGSSKAPKIISLAGLPMRHNIRQKEAGFLFRLARALKPSVILDLGASLGVSAVAMALGAPDAQVHTIEADKRLASLTAERIASLGISNVQLHAGLDVLPEFIFKTARPDIVFLGGDHQKVSSLNFLHWMLPQMQQGAVCVVHNIHCSTEMEETWALVQCLPEVTSSIDLFRMGIVFVADQLPKQHFKLRW